ncbi:NAD(P)-binding protein [Thozetella sp. PMI_491]|nr:NAD(P)-binding protein [Thozetella sp. PMI_491]
MSDSAPNEGAPTPRLHNEVYPFIYPSKFRGTLKDKVVLITGSAGALGSTMAESFATAGANLFLVYNKTPPPETLKDTCAKLGAVGVTFIKCNVSQLEQCEELIKEVMTAAGRLDVVINNAGANALIPLHVQDPKDFIYDISVNFHGPYYLMRLATPIFREQRSGVVLNISSRAGTYAIPWNGSYCSSKAALINLTECLQKELDIEGFDDVHLYSLHPGGVKSKMTKEKYSQDSVANLPEKVRPGFDGWLDRYFDSPYLNGMVCVALAAGVGKDVLRGKYIDVEQDLEDVVAQAEAFKKNPDLHSLHTTFLGSLPSRGKFLAELEEPWEFPGPDF